MEDIEKNNSLIDTDWDKGKDGVLHITCRTKQKSINDDIEQMIIGYSAMGILEYGSVEIILNPEDYTIRFNMSKHQEKIKKIQERYHFNVPNISFTDIFKIYDEANPRVKDIKPNIRKEMVVAGQIAIFVCQLWLKFQQEYFFFTYSKEKEEMVIALDKEYENVSTIEKLKKYPQYKTEGLFWKRDWLPDIYKQASTGMGKR